MKVMLVGDSWYGSDARGIKEAIAGVEGVTADDLGTDLIVPASQPGILRLVGRAAAPLQIRALKRQLRQRCADFSPDVVVVVKGAHLDRAFVEDLREIAPIVNIFPDASPHGQGPRLRSALGAYDLVVSAKAHHPPEWRTTFGYANACVHVPHGYSTRLHYRPAPPDPADIDYDVVLVAGGREEYADLMRALVSRLAPRGVRFAIAGGGWVGRGFERLQGVDVVGPKPGAAYVEWLRRGRIVIAPVQTVLNIDGAKERGDDVSARTFQCAAAHVFFIHRRTPEARLLYDEQSEVPMYDDAEELAGKIEHFLAHPHEREAMAAAAHARAVPAYSAEVRAREIVGHLAQLLADRTRRVGGAVT